MRHISTIALREVKLGFRNPWAYSFMALFALFSLALLLVQSQQQVGGYTSTTGTMINLILYLLPLMTLLLGSFSVTAEKEEGGWHLLSTYPLGTMAYLWGKYTGLAAVLLVIVSIGFGLSGVLGVLLGKAFSAGTFGLFFAFSVFLVLLFLGIAVLAGTLCRNRWQALTYGVAIWFFYILGWPTLLIAVLGVLPYLWIKPVLVALIFLNPAELTRLMTVVKMGGGSILGPDYYSWVGWIQQPLGTALFLAVCLVWIALSMGIAGFLWERGRRHA
ncbi:nitrous oxide metabolic protein [Paenibacillus sp. J31TS4]|uniref:ABC transporter permease n=1 Tax=Paenibacillus sp. J31TS4 TaxID=2807195 RepID=UPI001B09F53E|nr:ABC transporter permease subunit [Paenibacillus sp. J31TS4]GIP40439.1 nitrous oxide metabolic protein [Paenibacillus sp. J31TS4]